MLGQRDFDYVTFADYEADTKELADQASSIITAQKRELDQSKRLIAELIIAAGGEIKIERRNLFAPRRSIEMTTWANCFDDSLTFRASHT
jgi:hypothetical protein